MRNNRDSIKFRYVFGPVPSRRLGLSLGINNVHYKVCTYSCIYCQLGKTINLSIERKRFSEPTSIANEIKILLNRNVKFNYVTFVPNGEPTLDLALGETINAIRSITDTPIAILTNSSLLWREDVLEDMTKMDLVSLKIDTVSSETWKIVNRPHPELKLDRILDGISDFNKTFHGIIITETMLIHSLNTSYQELEETARFISSLRVKKAYLSVPIRPPAEKWVRKPSEKELLRAYNVFLSKIGESKIELLNMPESSEFQLTSEPIDYILKLTSVHPLRIDYAAKLLERIHDDPLKVISNLEKKGLIKLVDWEGHLFIVRKFTEKQ